MSDSRNKLPKLVISLLGSPEILLDQVPVNLKRRKTLALLAYLSVDVRFRNRDELAELLYPGMDRNHAMADLRQILYNLRKEIGKENLICNRFAISLNSSNNIYIDILQFYQFINEKRYKESIPLYRDEFLAGFYLDKNYAFENWQISIHDKLQRELISSLRHLINDLKSEKNFQEAIYYCRNLSDLCPFDEETHRELMRLYSTNSQLDKIIEQYEKCKNILRKELDIEPDRETSVLYHELTEKESNHYQGINLPKHKAQLIGRKKELNQIVNLVHDEKNKLVSLIGTGGTGKTLLSLYAADLLLKNYPDGVFFFDLSGIVSVENAISLISRKLEIADNRTRSDTPLMLLAKYLSKRTVLLILDNFEQLKNGNLFIRDIISKIQNTSILITSRSALSIDEEVIFYLPPLSSPDDSIFVDDPLKLREFEAIEFFRHRASIMIPDFTIDESNYEDIVTICRNLDGLPLAIELAASRLNILTCKEIKMRLSMKLDLLVNTSSSYPERHRTIKNTIEWSMNLLNREEQDLFIKLSVFQGGCSINAVEKIWGRKVLDLISSLFLKNMIIRKENKSESRFFMLETLREYASQKLEEREATNEIKDLHAYYYLSLAKEAERHLTGDDQVEWLRKLSDDDRNFTGALNWFRNQNLISESIVLIHSLIRYWYHRVYFEPGKLILKELLISGENMLSRDILGKGYCSLGWMSFVTGEWLPACEYYTKALTFSIEANDMETRILILGRLGVAERWAGQKESGHYHGQQAIKLAEESEDVLSRATSLNFYYSTRGGVFEDEEPEKYLEDALKLSRSSGDLWNISQSLVGLGDFFRQQQYYDLARDYYRKSLALQRLKKDQWMIAWTQGDLGQALIMKGERSSGEDYLIESILLFDRIGDHGSLATMLIRLIYSIGSSGNEEQAAFYLAASQKILNKSPSVDLQQMIAYYKSRYNREWYQGELMEYEELIQTLDNHKSSVTMM